MLMEARLLDERREGEAVGFVKGKDIGLVEGEAIGIAKGEAMGIAKGINNANIATAKRMLAKDCYSLQDIAELTNLTLADVKKLQEEQSGQSCK